MIDQNLHGSGSKFPAIVREAKKPFILAEREGFEPSVPREEYARLAIWIRPYTARTRARPVETENPCGSGSFYTSVTPPLSPQISLDLAQSGNFTPPWPHLGSDRGHFLEEFNRRRGRRGNIIASLGS